MCSILATEPACQQILVGVSLYRPHQNEHYLPRYDKLNVLECAKLKYLWISVSVLDFNFERTVGGSILTAG